MLGLDIFEVIEYLRSVVDLETNQMRLIVLILKQFDRGLLISMFDSYFAFDEFTHVSRTVEH